jgi:uncharacterized repeat protein (TIGR03943 family)
VKRDTQNMLLALLGGALVKIAANDIYLRYVKPSHRWWLFAAGGIILALAIVAIVRDTLAARRGVQTTPAHAGHEHGEPRSPWLLTLPVLAILLVAPPALGADAVSRSVAGNAVSQQGAVGDVGPLPPGPAPELSLSDFVARAIWDGSGSLNGHDVTITGFVVHRGGSVELARMVITCCAADAHPMLVRLSGLNPDVPVDSWLRIRARLLPGSATSADGYTPTVRVLDATPIAAPTDPYEF